MNTSAGRWSANEAPAPSNASMTAPDTAIRSVPTTPLAKSDEPVGANGGQRRGQVVDGRGVARPPQDGRPRAERRPVGPRRPPGGLVRDAVQLDDSGQMQSRSAEDGGEAHGGGRTPQVTGSPVSSRWSLTSRSAESDHTTGSGAGPDSCRSTASSCHCRSTSRANTCAASSTCRDDDRANRGPGRPRPDRRTPNRPTTAPASEAAFPMSSGLARHTTIRPAVRAAHSSHVGIHRHRMPAPVLSGGCPGRTAVCRCP